MDGTAGGPVVACDPVTDLLDIAIATLERAATELVDRGQRTEGDAVAEIAVDLRYRRADLEAESVIADE